MKPEILRALLAAGATAEMLVAAVEADYNAQEADRAKHAEYMRKWREVHVNSREFTRSTKESSPIPPKRKLYINKKISPLTPLAEPLFDEFWGVYPLKVGKGAARKAFRNALTRGGSAEIVAGAKLYAASKPEPKFTKHPTTWLNADCWLDEGNKVVPFTYEPKRTWAEIKAAKEQQA